MVGHSRRIDLQTEPFSHAHSVIVLLNHVDSAQSAARIIGTIVVQYGRVSYQQVQASISATRENMLISSIICLKDGLLQQLSLS